MRVTCSCFSLRIDYQCLVHELIPSFLFYDFRVYNAIKNSVLQMKKIVFHGEFIAILQATVHASHPKRIIAVIFCSKQMRTLKTHIYII